MFLWKNYLLIEKIVNKLNKTSLTARVRLALFRTVGGAPPVRSAGGVSGSAEPDLRLCLKNLQTFKKV
jgi:hypothetical protein